MLAENNGSYASVLDRISVTVDTANYEDFYIELCKEVITYTKQNNCDRNLILPYPWVVYPTFRCYVLGMKLKNDLYFSWDKELKYADKVFSILENLGLLILMDKAGKCYHLNFALFDQMQGHKKQ